MGSRGKVPCGVWGGTPGRVWGGSPMNYPKNAVSERTAQRSTIETGLIRMAGVPASAQLEPPKCNIKHRQEARLPACVFVVSGKLRQIIVRRAPGDNPRSSCSEVGAGTARCSVRVCMNPPSGNASLPDCFFSLIASRWGNVGGFHPPNP